VRTWAPALLVAMACAARPGGAQTPEPLVPGAVVTTTPDGRYDVNAFQRWLLGGGHRDLWGEEVQALVLDLDAFAGGLMVLREGGGLQTRSLRFRGQDGQTWNFRSLDKDATRSLDPELRRSVAAAVMQDRISALLPLSAMVVAPLLEAAGVFHAPPTLVVLPDDPRLGEYRDDFAGLVGWIEVRPDEGEDDTPGFAGSSRVIGSPRLLERIEDGPGDRIDAEAYLRARLMDLFVGDWDRHPDQWRWAGFEEDGVTYFDPIPRDRDWALSRLDGLVGSVSWAFWPHYVGFKRKYPNAFRATWSARALDRRLLSELTRDRWSAVSADLQALLTDEVIEDAVRRLPPTYEEGIGEELRESFRHRRDDLPRMADEWYGLLAGWVDVHATDEGELARIRWTPEGGVHLSIHSDPEGTSPPYFERALDAAETRELRLYMHGGDDRVIVEGEEPGDIGVKALGGGGDDTFEDRTARRGGRVHFYDDRGDNTFETGPGAKVDEAEFEEPFDPAATTHQAPFRDWGARWLPVPAISVDPDRGLFLGMGAIRTGYGFRSYPYHTKLTFSVGTGSEVERLFRSEVAFDFPVHGQRWRATAHLFVSGAEANRFYGFGNETQSGSDPDVFEAERRELLAELPVEYHVSEELALSFGPQYRRFEPVESDGTVVGELQPYGFGSFNEVGVVGALDLDARDRPVQTTSGLAARVEGRYFPAALDVEEQFGAVRAWAAGFLTVPGRAGPTLALRLGGEKVWGRAPFQEAAYIGGRNTLRGFRNQRFAGDGSVYVNSELRLKLARVLVLLPGDVGVYALGDAGRVFLQGESSNRWHSAIGGGAWFTIMDVFNLNFSVAASSEDTFFYFESGFAL